MPNKTYRLYPKAIDDLECIYLYSTDKFGIKRAEDYILAIETSLQHLADDPLISRKCDYVRQGLRAFNIGSHVIFLKRLITLLQLFGCCINQEILAGTFDFIGLPMSEAQ